MLDKYIKQFRNTLCHEGVQRALMVETSTFHLQVSWGPSVSADAVDKILDHLLFRSSINTIIKEGKPY